VDASSKIGVFCLFVLFVFLKVENQRARRDKLHFKNECCGKKKMKNMCSTSSSSSAPPALRRSRTTLLLVVALVIVASFVCERAHAAPQQQPSEGGGGLSRKFSIHSSEEGERDSDGDGIGDFKDAFLSSLAMILVAELGDETFIIAAIMAMRHPRLIVLSGALSALAIMTVLSTALGVIAPMLISPKVVNKCAFVLYTFFGCRLFYIAWRAKPGQSMQEEVDEVAEKIDVDKAPKGKVRRILSRVCTPIFLEAFVLTFLAEWGDRSQITTIALAAHKDPYGVTIGAIVGHAFCTSLAVIGGKILALKISQRLVAAVGGMLFIVFAWHALIFGAPGTELSKD